MMRFPAAMLLVISGLLLSGCDSGPDDGRCAIGTLGELPILNQRGSPIVRATVNGHPVAFRIDSGAFNSDIDESYVDALGIHVLPGWARVSGFGGSTFANGGKIDTLGMGSGKAEDVTFLLAGKFRRTIDGVPEVGVFGAEFLLAADLVIDMPNHTMMLLDMSNCRRVAPLWHGPLHKVPVTHDGMGPNTLGVTMTINGLKIKALLDTGADKTIITSDIARRLGVTHDMLMHDQSGLTRGIAVQDERVYRHRFASLQIGDMMYDNPIIGVSEDNENTVVLGADFLTHQRVWISRYDEAIYFQTEREIPPDDQTRKDANFRPFVIPPNTAPSQAGH